MDDGRIFRLRIEARGALGLRIRDRHRSNDKDRGSQSHGDFSHRKLSLRVCGWGDEKDRQSKRGHERSNNSRAENDRPGS